MIILWDSSSFSVERNDFNIIFQSTPASSLSVMCVNSLGLFPAHASLKSHIREKKCLF